MSLGLQRSTALKCSPGSWAGLPGLLSAASPGIDAVLLASEPLAAHWMTQYSQEPQLPQQICAVSNALRCWEVTTLGRQERSSSNSSHWRRSRESGWGQCCWFPPPSTWCKQAERHLLFVNVFFSLVKIKFWVPVSSLNSPSSEIVTTKMELMRRKRK